MNFIKKQYIKVKLKIEITYFYECIDVLLQAEARAEFAEKTVKKLQKEVDRLEGKLCSSTLKNTCELQNNLLSVEIIVQIRRNTRSYIFTLCYYY